MDPDFDFCLQDGDPFVIGREHLHSDGNKVVSVEAKAFDNGQAGQTALASDVCNDRYEDVVVGWCVKAFGE